MPGAGCQSRKTHEVTVGKARSTQPGLLEPDPVPIDGFAHRRELISPNQERELVLCLSQLQFKPFEFRGYTGRRLVASFGLRYDFADSRVHEAPEIPPFLLPLRGLAAEFAVIDASALKHALVTRYEAGAAIGWHKDRPVFQDVIGISLLSPCRFRLRRRTGATWRREALSLEPRSAYLLRGSVREDWEHSIPAAENVRYSVTFRSLT